MPCYAGRLLRAISCISSAPAALDHIPRDVTGHVAHPDRSIVSRLLPQRSTATLAALPAMSLIPIAPFTVEPKESHNRLRNLSQRNL